MKMSPFFLLIICLISCACPVVSGSPWDPRVGCSEMEEEEEPESPSDQEEEK
jgi:hypothetical protein